MGNQWLSEITALLLEAGIPARDAFPGEGRVEITQAVAGVMLRDVDHGSGRAEFEIRVLSPRRLGGWHCQSVAAQAAAILEANGMRCRMEKMGYRSGNDCFEIGIIGLWQVVEVPVWVRINGQDIAGVVAFSAEQDRDRRAVVSSEGAEVQGYTAPAGGWKIRLERLPRRDLALMGEPEEPFLLETVEPGLRTLYYGCCWNRVIKTIGDGQTTIQWEGFARKREEVADGNTAL